MQTVIFQSLDAVLLAIIPGVFGYVAKAVKKFLQSKHLEGVAFRAVKYAEQLFPEAGQGDAKYRAASQYLAKKAYTLFKINLDPDDIKAFIEAAVSDLNKEFSAAFSDAPAVEAEPVEEQPKEAEAEEPAVEEAASAVEEIKENTRKVGDMTLEELKDALNK